MPALANSAATRTASALPWQVPSRAPSPAQSAAVTRRIRKNEAVFSEDYAATHVYRAVSGAVRTSRLLSDGRRQIEEFHFAGDVFGLEGGDEITGGVAPADSFIDKPWQEFRPCD